MKRIRKPVIDYSEPVQLFPRYETTWPVLFEDRETWVIAPEPDQRPWEPPYVYELRTGLERPEVLRHIADELARIGYPTPVGHIQTDIQGDRGADHIRITLYVWSDIEKGIGVHSEMVFFAGDRLPDLYTAVKYLVSRIDRHFAAHEEHICDDWWDHRYEIDVAWRESLKRDHADLWSLYLNRTFPSIAERHKSFSRPSLYDVRRCNYTGVIIPPPPSLQEYLDKRTRRR